MSDPFSNLHEKTGHTMPEWFALIEPTGLEKHTEIMNWLKTQHGVSHGFANGIALQYRARGEEPTETDLVDAQYAGRKEALRPILDRLLEVATGFGADVEVAPKKTSVSLRRGKQFAVIEAVSATRVQVGIQLKANPRPTVCSSGARCARTRSTSPASPTSTTSWWGGCERPTLATESGIIRLEFAPRIEARDPHATHHR